MAINYQEVGTAGAGNAAGAGGSFDDHGGIVAAGSTADNPESIPDHTLEQRVQHYLNNPSRYTDQLYHTDREAYLAAPVYKQFQDSFGRAPTTDELTTYMPLVVSLGHEGAMAEIAKAHTAYENTPERMDEKKRQESEKKALGLYGTVNDLFKSNLGREATTDEQKHFAVQMAQGVDAYTLGQFLQALPENVKKQDAAFREGVSGNLQKQDSQYYNEQILPALQAAATRQGRSLDSSGITNSLALAAQQQNRQREGFLSNLTAAQYAGSQGLAQNAYQQAYGNYMNTQDYYTNTNRDMFNSNMNRLNGLSDYSIQKNAYDQYLQRYGKRSSGQGYGQLAGGAAGALIGGYFGAGNPAAISAGYNVGSGLGGAAGSAWG